MKYFYQAHEQRVVFNKLILLLCFRVNPIMKFCFFYSHFVEPFDNSQVLIVAFCIFLFFVVGLAGNGLTIVTVQRHKSSSKMFSHIFIALFTFIFFNRYCWLSHPIILVKKNTTKLRNRLFICVFFIYFIKGND